MIRATMALTSIRFSPTVNSAIFRLVLPLTCPLQLLGVTF